MTANTTTVNHYGYSVPSPNGFQTSQEERLVSRLRRGDPGGFDELMATHYPRMLAVARRLLGNEEDARDAVQEALFSAYRSIHGFRQGSRLGTWLYRIAVNAALMRKRRAVSRSEVDLDDLLPVLDEEGCLPGPQTHSTTCPEKELLRKETRFRVRKCIQRLPEASREVLLLRDIEERDTGEVAQVLRITPNAVKIRLCRARHALAGLVQQEMRDCA